MGRWNNITPSMIYRTLKTTVKFFGPDLVFESKDVSVQSLRVAFAMALLYAGVNSNIIKLVGHWHINDMLCYLHV